MKIEITSPDKIIFPKNKIKKIDVVNYYIEISSYMLPYIKNRLLSVIKCHNGIDAECFFKKHPTNDKDNVETKMIDSEEYFYVNSQNQIVYLAQMGTIEFHTWASSVNNGNQPDCMVFDLDPDEELSLEKTRDAVVKVKSVLDKLNLKSFLKTSGGKGYHIVIPFSKTKNWKSFYEFSKKIALYVENQWSEVFTTNIKKSERKNKIFIDYLRNNKGSTCVAPYSLRARENATISMPISWNDLYKIQPNQINIKNYKKYLSNAWKDFFLCEQILQ